ncbi:MAG: oligoendopeptidase F, partial [Vicinamibacterales bacterium]
MSEGTTTLPNRSDLPHEGTWDIESVFASNADWETAFSAAGDRLAGLEQFRGRLGKSAATLLAGLELRDELLLDAYRVGLYASMRVAEDATNAVSLAMNDRASGLFANAFAAAAFYEPEMLALDSGTLARFQEEEAGLVTYRHYFDTLERRRPHVRSAEVEEVLAMASDPTSQFESIHTAIADADLQLGTIRDEQGHEVALGQGNYDRYLFSTDRSVRQAAWETSSDAYLALKNTLAANYAGA